MSASSGYSYLVKIKEDYKEGGYYMLTSPNLPGFFMGGKNIKKLRTDVPSVIKILFKLNYQLDVHVRPLTDTAPSRTTQSKLSVRKSHLLDWSACPA
jgi:hypothetical protein